LSSELYLAIDSLEKEELIVYPTDTIYGIGCDATSSKAVSQVFEIKQREESKSLIVLVSSIVMLNKYVEIIPKEIINYLKTNEKPTTIIYNNPLNLAKNIIAKDNTIAIRIVFKGFCHELIKTFGKPIVSTSANISNKPAPINFKDIDESILSKVDYVVNLPLENKSNKPSTIIKFVNGKIEFLRK